MAAMIMRAAASARVVLFVAEVGGVVKDGAGKRLAVGFTGACTRRRRRR